MAKPAKRNKKYNPIKKDINILESRFQKTYEELFFFGDEFRKPISYNAHHLRQRLPPETAKNLQLKFTDMIISTPLNWSMIVVILIKGDDENSIDVVPTTIRTKGTNIIEFANYIKDNLRELINEALIESEIDPKRFITYAYSLSYLDFEEDILVDSMVDKALALGVTKLVGVLPPYTFTDKDLLSAILNCSICSPVSSSDAKDFVPSKHMSEYSKVC